MVAQTLGSGYLEKYVIPLVAEMPGDCLCDLTGIRRVRVGTVENEPTRHGRNAFHERGRVHRGCGVVAAP